MVENGYHRGESGYTNDHAPTPWISAWHDPVAGMMCPTSSHLSTADMHADGDFRLVMVDMKKRIRVYKGTAIQFEQKLMDLPVATKCFYREVSTPPLPSLAVASGNQVFIYRHLKPYLKFTLPSITINRVEQGVWNELLSKENTDMDAAIKKLIQLRDEGKASTRTLDFLAVESANPSGNLNYEERMEKLHQYQGPSNQNSCVTCMEVLKLNMDDPTATSMLVVGTEHRMIYILDPPALNVLTSVELDGVPAFMSVIGLYDVEYRVTVACRNGTIYSIKNGQLLSTTIELETQAVGLVRLEKNVYVGTMDQQIHGYHFKGKKIWSLQMPAPIVTMCALQSRNVNAKALLVSLNNGEVRCYNGKHLANTIYIPNDYATGMIFGQYGREENALVMSLKSGGIMVKMLYRNATLQPPEQRAGPPPEQDIPLNVPKKTKLYVEQTAREREQAIDMHRIFQRDLCKLRLQTARAYVVLLGQGDGPVSSIGSTHLRLNSAVRGMGPEFQIELELQNTGKRAISDITVALSTGPIYTCNKAQKYIAMLVPQLLRKVRFDLLCVSMEKTDTVRAFLISRTSQVPLIVAAVAMPMSEERLVE
eukprot:GEMP01024096.1.p1 GENE.GEMP01024096.1~~GEMP01024096.1.p1  ORF type:complete len:593 (+),score=123.82 GEMP01024096.1:73-1851(+)